MALYAAFGNSTVVRKLSRVLEGRAPPRPLQRARDGDVWARIGVLIAQRGSQSVAIQKVKGHATAVM
eukprot:4509833-Alexandrium_andersonii.AAC.1